MRAARGPDGHDGAVTGQGKGRRTTRPRPARPRGPEPRPGTHVLPTATAEILRDADVADGWMLLLDGVPTSYLDLADPTHLEFEYVRWIGHVLDLAAGPGVPLRVVHLGGGACTLPVYVAATRPGSRQLVAEYDAELVALVREQFGIRTGPGLKIRAGDARDVLARCADDSADVVVRDAFAGPATPAHLTSVEFVADVARVLRADGVYCANVTDGPAMRLARAEIATARAVFGHVALVAETPVLRGRRYGNLVVLGSATPLPTLDLARVLARSVAPTRVLDAADAQRFASGTPPITDASLDTPTPPPPPSTRPDGWHITNPPNE